MLSEPLQENSSCSFPVGQGCSLQALRSQSIKTDDSFDSLFDMDELSCADECVTLTHHLENTSLKYNTTHKMWNVINIQIKDDLFNLESIDIVIIVDISASMMMDEKLSFVQASLDYLLNQLNEGHQLSLIVFNHEVTLLSPLVRCTEQNKNIILSKVQNLEASGSTNIKDAIITGIDILSKREDRERISSVVLITDGLYNTGISNDECNLSSLGDLNFPKNCIFNTFGFGPDHDSKYLHDIALKTQGAYYYVPSKNEINTTFGECIHSILSTRIKDVKIKISAYDGTRIVTLATPFKIEQKKMAKEYDINIGLMQSGEKKNILMRLSLRKLEKTIKKNLLYNVKICYYDLKKGNYQLLSKDIRIDREENNIGSMPILLDQNLNRYAAAKSILESVELSNKLQFLEAQRKLKECFKSIKNSSSGNTNYSKLILKDIKECCNGMSDIISFQNGVHTAHALASMHFLERSSGVLNTLRKNLLNNSDNIKEIGYGYITNAQYINNKNVELQCSKIIDKYRNKQ
jgi:hypothetical protein